MKPQKGSGDSSPPDGKVIFLGDPVPVMTLAKALGIEPSQVVAHLLEFACYVTNLDESIPFADAARVAEMYGLTAKHPPKRH